MIGTDAQTLFPCFCWLCLSQVGSAFAAHAFALYDTPKYPADFTHFDYVNPDAPKGGELYLANPDRRTSFDKFNPFSLKGVAAAGVRLDVRDAGGRFDG